MYSKTNTKNLLENKIKNKQNKRNIIFILSSKIHKQENHCFN